MKRDIPPIVVMLLVVFTFNTPHIPIFSIIIRALMEYIINHMGEKLVFLLAFIFVYMWIIIFKNKNKDKLVYKEEWLDIKNKGI